MSENDMIAEYIKERMTELLTTCDFALYRLGYKLKEMASDVAEAAMKIEWGAVLEAMKEEPNGMDEWKQQTMSRFERVE